MTYSKRTAVADSGDGGSHLARTVLTVHKRHKCSQVKVIRCQRPLVTAAHELEEEHGAKSHIMRSKHNAGVPAHKEIIGELTANCDVVIAGIGD